MANTFTTLSGLFKKVYHNRVVELIPGECPLQDLVKFDKQNKVGGSFNLSLDIQAENGISLLGSSGNVVTLSSTSAGKILQAEVKAVASVLRSGITWETISRAKSGDKAAVMDATKNRVDSNLKSHKKHREFHMLYGQSEDYIAASAYEFTGTVNSAGDTVTAGSGTVAGVTFTDGINVAQKKILLNVKHVSAGFLIGAEGLAVQQIDASDTVLANGSIVGVDIDNGIIEVSFTPDASTGEVCYITQQNFKTNTMVGLEKILKNTSDTIFGISAASNSLWRGNNFDHADAALTFENVIDYVGKLCNYGLSSDVVLMVPNKVFADLLSDESSQRRYDASYSTEKGKKGHKMLEFYSQNGVIKIVPNRFVRAGQAFLLEMESLQLIGSSDIELGIPDSDTVFKESDSQNVINFSSWNDCQIVCHRPRRSAIITNIKVY